ncbi:site-specific integrase [Desulfobacterota bacterium AH_259_B03_O07]|nr:site-specific integrase [Desulfobacterota bacterium AH_259_B03_O07]
MGVFKRSIESKNGRKTPYWYIRFAMNGKMKWESVGKVGVATKDIARSKLDERKRQVRLGQLDVIVAKIPTLSEYKCDYIRYVKDVKGNRSWRSTIHYLNQLEKLFGDKKLSQISSRDIDNYKLSRIQEVKPSTVNRELACLNHLLNLAKRQKRFFGENPVSISKLLPENNKTERILRTDEEKRLLDTSSIHLKPIIITALNTGMRKGEILTLKWSNVDLENKIINLEHTNTKSKKSRRIPINNELRKLLLELKLKSGGSDYVFLSSNGSPYKRHDSLKKVFRDACKRADITGLRFHDLRHTVATRMIESNANIVAVKEILGHSDLKTTMRYAHPNDSLKDAVEKLALHQ